MEIILKTTSLPNLMIMLFIVQLLNPVLSKKLSKPLLIVLCLCKQLCGNNNQATQSIIIMCICCRQLQNPPSNKCKQNCPGKCNNISSPMRLIWSEQKCPGKGCPRKYNTAVFHVLDDILSTQTQSLNYVLIVFALRNSFSQF